MDLSSSQAQAAVIAAIASIFGAVAGTVVTLWLGMQKIRREHLLEHRSENLVRKLLSHNKWRLRTFKTIQHHVAGFEDDELRKILIRAGALRFTDAEGIEIWGLMERNMDLVEGEYGTRQN
jgi:hypothetical protein